MSPTRLPFRARRSTAALTTAVLEVAALVAVALVAVACAPSPSSLPAIEGRAERVVEGLDGASSLALLPDGRIAVARPDAGEVTLVDPRSRIPTEALVTTLAPGPSGLAVGSDFPSSRRVWLAHGALLVAVETGRPGATAPAGKPNGGAEPPGGEGDPGGVDTVAIAELPDPAGPVVVGPDGRVYAGIAAGGVVVRLNREGTVPVDNPRGPLDPVWASGLAAPAALAFDPGGSLWVADPGAGAVVRLGPGSDAGWPLVRGRPDQPLERLAARQIGPAFPAVAWTPDRGAPLAVAALRAAVWGATVAIGLDDGRIVRLRVDDEGKRHRTGPVAAGLDGPVVGLAEDPDGRLWALTPSTLWRIDPPGAAPFDPGDDVPADTVAPASRPY